MLFDLNEAGSVEVVLTYLKHGRQNGQTVGLTSGCFDLVHFAHIAYFLRCRRHCDLLAVGVDSDEMVRGAKGPTRPVIPDFHRAIMVDALKPVSFAFIMNDIRDFARAAELLTPDIIFKNDEFKGREDEIVGREHAGQIMIMSDQSFHASTTAIIKHVTRCPD